MVSERDWERIVSESLPLIRELARGRYAIAVSGSRGKGLADALSDVDFRLYREAAPPAVELTERQSAFQSFVVNWRRRGIEIDGCWIRPIEEIDRQLGASLVGYPETEPIVWTVWGYHLLTDIRNQQILEDPHGILAGWQDRLQVYPPALKRAVIDRHWQSLTYWRDDYHYRNKVTRGDAVFLASLAARLVHDLIQTVFALNDTYYPGDGDNARWTSTFAIKPVRFEERIDAALYPVPGPTIYGRQRATLVELIDDVAALTRA